MPIQIIVGAQWGDEGKGKIVDHLSNHVDIVARYQGGANADIPLLFRIKAEKRKKNMFYISFLPEFFINTLSVSSATESCIDPVALMAEIDQLKKAGIKTDGRLFISHNAHLIMPYHKLLDSVREQGSDRIGTTGRGIGPAYIDKYMRTGIRVVDLLDRDLLCRKLKRNIETNNETSQQIVQFKDPRCRSNSERVSRIR